MYPMTEESCNKYFKYLGQAEGLTLSSNVFIIYNAQYEIKSRICETCLHGYYLLALLVNG